MILTITPRAQTILQRVPAIPAAIRRKIAAAPLIYHAHHLDLTDDDYLILTQQLTLHELHVWLKIAKFVRPYRGRLILPIVTAQLSGLPFWCSARGMMDTGNWSVFGGRICLRRLSGFGGRSLCEFSGLVETVPVRNARHVFFVPQSKIQMVFISGP